MNKKAKVTTISLILLAALAGYVTGSMTHRIPDPHSIEVEMAISPADLVTLKKVPPEVTVHFQTFYVSSGVKTLHGPSLTWLPGDGDIKREIYNRGVLRDQIFTISNP